VSKAIDDLKHEHDAILSGLKILTAMASRVDHGLDLDKKGVRDFLAFLREFGDKCHHGKEENILFPAMVKAGAPAKGGPIEVMLSEHARGRELIKQMEASSGGAPDLPKFSRAAKDYAALLQSHIEKENGVLFPSAEAVLGEQQLDQIYDAFEKHEEKVIGAGRHEELHAILNQLKQKFFA